MSNALRRLIQIPHDAPASQIPRLADALRTAIDTQNRLAAKSPHVLRFSAALQQDGPALWVEHEPATPLPTQTLFDEQAPLPSEDELLHAAAAVLDTLAAAHTSAGGRPILHGGLCPGVILTGADGLVKVTDFGFAPAICKALGVESYLNLAVGPAADATGKWEVLAPEVMDRDDRICAFIDPDKYGQDTLASFEPASDIIAAGILLHLLADHRHPYLYFEHQAHRVVDMARMMSFGVPSSIRRKDLCESPSPAALTFCELVAALLARLPGDRPPASDLIRRLVAAAPTVDVDVIKAKRWLEQLEALSATKEWRELEAALKDRPQLKVWPAELRAGVDSIERQFKEYVTEEGRRAAVEAERQTARAWLDRLRATVEAADWDAAQEVRAAKPSIEHWPDDVQQALPTLLARIDHEIALKKAVAWRVALQKAVQLKDWAAVGRRFAQRPAPEHCPPDVLEYATAIEVEYKKYLEEQERQRREIERQHAEVRAWLDRAKSLTDSQEWVAAIDHLATLPQVEHWPKAAHEEADELTSLSRNHLGDAVASDLDAITENIRRQGETAIREVLAERLAGLVPPDRVETTVDFVMWAPPETDADGRAPVLVRLRPPTGVPAEEPIQGELEFHLRGDEARICRGMDTLRQRAGDDLFALVFRLQTAQIRALEAALRASIFPDATIQAQLAKPQPRLPAEIHLLGADVAGGVVRVELCWIEAELTWAPANGSVFVGQAVELARTVSLSAVRADFLAQSAMLKTYDGLLDVSLNTPPAPAPAALPQSVSYEVHVGFRTADRRELRPLHTGAAVCNRVGQTASDAKLSEIEAKLAKLIVAAQDASRHALHVALKQRIKAASARVSINAPKRSKMPVNEAPFELKPKTGNPVVMTARWNTASLAYDLPAGWEKTLAPLLAPPPPRPSRVKVPRAPRAWPSRRVLIAVGAALVVVMASGGVYLGLRDSQSAPPRVIAPPPEMPAPPPQQQPPPKQITPPAPPPAQKPSPPPELAPPSDEKPPPIVPTTTTEETTPPPDEQITAAPPEQAATMPEEAPPPPRPRDLGQELRDFWQPRFDLSDPQGVSTDRLLAELLPAAAREDSEIQRKVLFLTAAAERTTVSNMQQVGQERVTLDVAIALKSNSGSPSQTFAMSPSGGGWLANSDNVLGLNKLADEAQQLLLQKVRDARERIETGIGSGNLTDIQTQYAAIRPLLEPLLDQKDVTELRDLVASLPPTWEAVESGLADAGYAADGEIDAVTGYPPRLKDRQGDVLVRVSVPPGDELWRGLESLEPPIKTGDPLYDSLNLADSVRPWRILYIDAVPAPTDDFPGARTVAKDRARGLPTRDEWFLVALKLRADTVNTKDLFGGLWQWCDSPAGSPDDEYWLCGGSQLLLDRKPPGLMVPQPGDDFKRWWTWLTNPLVMQRRPASFGDQLTGVRTVLRIHPRD